MQYCSGGVGHLATQQCNNTLLADKHTFVADPASQTLHEPTRNQDENEDRAENDEEEDGGRVNDRNRVENEGDKDEDRADNESEGDEDCTDNLFSGDIHDVDIVNAAGFAAL